MEYVIVLAAVVAAYACGSLSFAVVVSRAMGLQDPRTYGSGNPGATNVLRSGSKKAAAITLLLDALKGFVPVFLVNHWGALWGLEDGTVALVGLAAFVGHVWPVFFGFKGGKGVATAAGVLFGIHWALGLATLATWIIIAWFFRYSSLAAIVSGIFAPFAYTLGDRIVWYQSKSIMLAVFVMGLILVVRHHENINRLLAGTEGRLGADKTRN